MSAPVIAPESCFGVGEYGSLAQAETVATASKAAIGLNGRINTPRVGESGEPRWGK